MASVDEATARRLLAEHRGIIRAVLRRHLPRAAGAFHPIEVDDLRSIAECAVLEAWLSYEAGDASKETTPGSGFRLYVRRIASWRVGDAVGRLRRAEPPAARRALDPRRKAGSDTASGGEAGEQPLVEALPARLNGSAPDARCYRGELGAWLSRAIGRLPLRQRLVISGELVGETQAALADQLGLSPGRLSQERSAAIRTLRELALADGLDGFSLDS